MNRGWGDSTPYPPFPTILTLSVCLSPVATELSWCTRHSHCGTIYGHVPVYQQIAGDLLAKFVDRAQSQLKVFFLNTKAGI